MPSGNRPKNGNYVKPVNKAVPADGRGYSAGPPPKSTAQLALEYTLSHAAPTSQQSKGISALPNHIINSQLGGGVPGDQYGGLNAMDLLAGLSRSGGSSGGGSGSRGGGGGSSGPSAASLDALLGTGTQSYNDLLAQQLAALQAAYGQQTGALDEGLGRQNALFDQTGNRLQTALQAAQTRTGGIVNELGTAAGNTRTNVAGAFNAGDQRLQAIQRQYDQLNAANAGGANQTLQAFGVAPTVGVDGGLDQQIGAARTFNQQQATGQDALYAGRGSVYAGLGADANQQSGAQYDQLSAQLEAQRVAAANNTATQRAQLALQQAQAEAQAKMQNAQSIQALQLQIAQGKA